jgi:hypothetical protein
VCSLVGLDEVALRCAQQIVLNLRTVANGDHFIASKNWRAWYGRACSGSR